MNIYGNPTESDNLIDATLTNTKLQGSTIIVCEDETTYNLECPNNGTNAEVLTTDGEGHTFWSDAVVGISTFQDVYNNSSNPANVVLVNNKAIIFKDILNQVAFTISSDGTTTQAGGLKGGFYNSKMNTIQRADIGDSKIEVIENIPLTTIRTTFTENQEFVTKKYVNDTIPPPSNPNLQDVYNNSTPPDAIIIMPNDHMITYYNDASDTIACRIVAGHIGQSSYLYTNDLKVDGDIFVNGGNIIATNISASGISSASSFVKAAGTSQQYLMADGSVLQYSANSGNSNFYLYNNISGVMTPPPADGQLGYNNAIQANATILYISHRTRDTIDIDVFLAQITTIQDVYLQDQNLSTNFIRYNITGTPTITPNSYIAIPVLYTTAIPPNLPNGAGTGLTNFGSGHNILVSFFTNSIEVDTRLSALETKTQNQTAISNTTTFTGNIESNTTGIYDIGGVSNQFRRGYFSGAVRSPVFDTMSMVPVALGNSNASAINIGKTGIITTILGTTNINSVYTLPLTAPAVGNVLTCGVLGSSSWITPSPNAFSSIYPYPTSLRTVITIAGTRTLCNTYTMTSNITFTSASIFFPTPGTDTTRVGIYRGDLTTATLVGQTNIFAAPSSDYYTRTITVIAGQSLTFTIGQQIVIAFSQSGSSTTLPTTTGVSNIALAFTSASSYSLTGFPTLISTIVSPAATTIRMCMDLL